MRKLGPFCVFVFVVPKHIAHKMVITSNFVSQKLSSNFKNFNLRLIKQKKLKKIIKNMKNCTILSPTLKAPF